jgi:hypothetical protein
MTPTRARQRTASRPGRPYLPLLLLAFPGARGIPFLLLARSMRGNARLCTSMRGYAHLCTLQNVGG